MNSIRILAVSFVIVNGALAAEAPVFRATGGKNVLILNTPYGTKTLVGSEEFAKLKSYRFTIPLDDLKPAPIQLVLNTTPVNPPEAPVAAAPSASSAAAPSAASAEPVPAPALSEEKFDETAAGSVDRQVERSLTRANRLYNQRKFSESEAVVDDALELKPESVRAWMMKGSLLKLKGREKEAAEAWEKARSLDPSRREAPALMEGGSV